MYVLNIIHEIWFYSTIVVITPESSNEFPLISKWRLVKPHANYILNVRWLRPAQCRGKEAPYPPAGGLRPFVGAAHAYCIGKLEPSLHLDLYCSGLCPQCRAGILGM